MTGGFCACVLSCLPSNDLIDGKQDITNALLVKGSQGAYTAELFYYLNQLSLKFSILCFYWRVFSSSNYMRTSIYGIGIFIILWFIASVGCTCHCVRRISLTGAVHRCHSSMRSRSGQLGSHCEDAARSEMRQPEWLLLWHLDTKHHC